MQHIIPWPCQIDNLFATILNTIIPLTEQLLGQIEITGSNRKKDLCINKVCSMVGVDIVEYMEMAKVTPKNVYNIFFQSRFGSQSTESGF